MLLLRRLGRDRPEFDWVRPRIAPVLTVALVSGIAVVWGEAMTAAGSPSPAAFWSYVTVGLPGLARLGLEGLALAAALVGASSLWLWVLGAISSLAGFRPRGGYRPGLVGDHRRPGHLLAAGLWAGGILALGTLRPPGGWRTDAGRDLLRFSPPALGAFAMTVGLERSRQSRNWGASASSPARPTGRSCSRR